MKKLFRSGFLILWLLFVVGEAEAQVRFGTKAGMNVSSIALPLNGYAPKIGYQFGIMADMRLYARFSIQPALLLSSKGVIYKYDERDLSGLYVRTIRTKQSLNYLEFPVLALYRQPLRKGAKLYVGMGPYLGVGLISNTKIKGYDKQEIDPLDNWNRESFPFDRFDYGLSIAAGVETGRFLLGINFNKGIKPLAKDTKNYNNTLSITAGYFFTK
ncbi:porin family protein [Salmonirosea aquatica]|uniref:Outer membrane beta-barrel protein n=1 Tax=Salmonirosea aquatica TaxID=2654236 RepID=A0A7C9BEL6_9BACT|nr:outer membrane beta-barrel protein [Cytophagaceae bacterium SJW1-29]